jgi:hypothetical protein
MRIEISVMHWIMASWIIAGSSPYTGWSVTSGSISGTKLVYHCLFHL